MHLCLHTGKASQACVVLIDLGRKVNSSLPCMQDTARSFAGEHNDKAKYELYMEATHFAETIENLYNADYQVGQMKSMFDAQTQIMMVGSSACLCYTSI